ncbi:hypothetical protein ACMYYO_08525 [Dermacoccaceae bacterium W4C1]
MTTAVTGELIATRKAGAFTHLTFVAPGVGEVAKPGQLVSFAVGGPGSALVGRRTVPLHAVTPSGVYGGTLEVVLDGARDPGTAWLADRRVHDEVPLIAPLGRAFPLPEQPLPCLLVGVDEAAGSLRWLAESLRDRGCPVSVVVAGHDDRRLFSVIELRRLIGQVSVVTPEEGDLDEPLDRAVRAAMKSSDAAVVYACARARQLATVVARAEGGGAVVQVAINEQMPCGTGLCAACTVPVRGRDDRIHSVRACSEGPILRGDRVEWSRYLDGLVQGQR